MKAGWVWCRAEADCHPREGTFGMGFKEYIEVCQAEKGWKGIPGRGNSCAKAHRLR